MYEWIISNGMRNKIVMSGLMALVLGLGVSGTALAYQGDFTKKGPNYTPEFEAQITEVMTNKDYDGWKNLIEKKVGSARVTEKITKDNFDKFVEAWKLAKEGKIKEANTIRRELELRTSDGQRQFGGMRHGMGMGRGNGYGMNNR
ncbi:MAG: hypothetical protein WC603_00470 [Candidatus Paceibacterota bacterium]|jgi:hypothetical protein